MLEKIYRSQKCQIGRPLSRIEEDGRNSLRRPKLCIKSCRAIIIRIIIILVCNIGFGGLGVACWPLVPKFAGSNPAEAFGFLRAKKSSARLPSEGK